MVSKPILIPMSEADFIIFYMGETNKWQDRYGLYSAAEPTLDLIQDVNCSDRLKLDNEIKYYRKKSLKTNDKDDITLSGDDYGEFWKFILRYKILGHGNQTYQRGLYKYKSSSPLTLSVSFSPPLFYTFNGLLTMIFMGLTL